MACTSPLKAYRAPGGGVVFKAVDGYFDQHLELPCGQCMDCRLAKMRDWAIRAVHEAQMHEKNCFITLTYDKEHLPKDLSVDVKHWQTFAKALRKKIGRFRYLHCGEYGELLRPHYHAILFGVDFSEDRIELPAEGEHTSWTSKTLERVWGKGFVQIGDVSFDSAAYVARYTLTSLSASEAAERGTYERFDSETGEVWAVHPVYATMSRRPGLGSSWFDMFRDDVYPDDFVVMKGQKMRPPKFYDKRLDREDDKGGSQKDRDLFIELKKRRSSESVRHRADETFERREDRDLVLKGKLKLKRRSL